MGNEFDKKYISETLEEAIKREYETRKFNSDFPFDPQSFKLGAKWQQERSYNEEEVLDLLYKRDLYLLNRDEEVELELPNDWLEQFKTK